MLVYKGVAEPGLPCSLKTRFSRAMDGISKASFIDTVSNPVIALYKTNLKNTHWICHHRHLSWFSINEEFDVIVMLWTNKEWSPIFKLKQS